MRSIACADNQYYIEQQWSNLHNIPIKKNFVTKEILHQTLPTMLIPLTWSMKVFFSFDTWTKETLCGIVIYLFIIYIKLLLEHSLKKYIIRYYPDNNEWWKQCHKLYFDAVNCDIADRLCALIDSIFSSTRHPRHCINIFLLNTVAKLE